MDIRDLLMLEASASSIKKIDKFLSEITPEHRDYPKAISHLAFLTFQLGNVSEAFQILFTYLEKCPDKEKTTVYDVLIKIYYEQKDYDNALSMIENKKLYLPNYHKNGYYEDLIVYYQKTKNDTELIRVLLIYLSDDISDERRLKALLTLCDCYFRREDFTHFMEKNYLIETISLSLKEDAIYRKAKYQEAYVLTKTKSYPKALQITDELLETNVSKELKASLLALKLEILVYLGDYRRASIFEAEYEAEVDEGEVEARVQFANACLTLYDALSNRFNYQNYKDKLAGLLEEKSHLGIEQPKEKKKKPSKQVVELNFMKGLETAPVAEPPIIKKKPIIIEETEIKKNITVIERTVYKMQDIALIFDSVSSVFERMNGESFHELREFLRIFLTEVQKISFFDEAYFLTKDTTLHGYYYKKERLYDKKEESISLDNSIFWDVMEMNEEIIIPDSTQTEYIEMNSKRLYHDLEKQSLLCFPMEKGAVLFSATSEDLLIKPLNYETLKLSISYLSMKWRHLLAEGSLQQKYHDFAFMMNHMVTAYKRQMDNYIYLSKKASEMFSCYEAISIQEFYAFLEPKDLIVYKKTIEDLLKGNIKEACVHYQSNRSGALRDYEENFSVDQEGAILSIISDVTKEVEIKRTVLQNAYVDTMSGLYTKSKLDLDLTSFIETNKFSLLAFNVIDFKRYNDIYGMDFGNQLIYAIGKYLKSYEKSYTVYHLDGDKFVVSIPFQNDKRTVNKIAYQMAAYLTEKLHELNYRLNIYFEIGVLRFPTDTNEHDHNTLIQYLMSALGSAHQGTIKTNVANYSLAEYKKRFFESQVRTHISESIDLNHLEVTYRQVVNISNQTCDHYLVSINLSNFAVSEEDIFRILKKRDMIPTMERYIIHRALFELSEIYKKTKLYFSLAFTVSKETLLQETFKDYILEQLNFFSIPKSAISIIYNETITDKTLEVLHSLKLNQIMLGSNNSEFLKQMHLDSFYYLLPKSIKEEENDFLGMMKEYCEKKHIAFILDGVNNKSVISQYALLGCSLYSGRVYGARLTAKEIVKAYLA